MPLLVNIFASFEGVTGGRLFPSKFMPSLFKESMSEIMGKIPSSTITIRATVFLHLLLLSLLTSATAAHAATERSFSVGIVPQLEIRQIHDIWTPILNELQQRTGYTFKFSGSASIPEFERQFSAGQFDFAYMNPYHLLLANNRQGYIPLVRDVSSELRGILVVKKGSIKNINELAGKTIAFPAPNALGASLIMRADLSNRLKLNYRPIYVKSHSSVYLNVLMGLATAGGGVDKTLEQQPENIRNNLAVIYRTAGFASHPFVVHPRVPVAIQKKVQQALLDFADTNRGKAILNEVPFQQLGRASYDDYKPIATLGLEQFFVQE